jgi:MFS family permease
MWGASQPVFGAVADKYGAGRVIVLGAVLLAGGLAATPFVSSQWGLMLTMGVLSAAGRRRRQFLDPDRRHRPAPAAGAPAVRGRLHQCRRLVRPVRVRAAGADPDRQAGWITAM